MIQDYGKDHWRVQLMNSRITRMQIALAAQWVEGQDAA
jgi:hypothetical protein